jgi:hypothetical protein
MYKLLAIKANAMHGITSPLVCKPESICRTFFGNCLQTGGESRKKLRLEYFVVWILPQFI